MAFSFNQELQRRREEELTSLQEQLADLTSKLEQLELNMKKYTASMAQMAELQRQREAENKEEEDAYRVKKKTYDLLPNADENIAKLQVGTFISERLYSCRINSVQCLVKNPLYKGKLLLISGTFMFVMHGIETLVFPVYCEFELKLTRN